MTRIGVVGASARAAVHSLARAGYAAWAVDQFADRDLARVAECLVCPSDRYPDALPELAARFPPGPVLYTGGLENHPHIIAELARTRELWGNLPDVLGRVRDPFALSHTLAACGFATPHLIPHDAPCPTEGRWLRKPFRSGAGLGIRFARPNESPSPHHYFQEFIAGVPMSAQFVNDTLLGVTEQLAGESWLHASGFMYCGNIGPVEPPAAVADIGKQLCAWVGLRGFWGVDFVLSDGSPVVLEVNPRYTAAVEVLEHAKGVAAFRGEARRTPPVLGNVKMGKVSTWKVLHEGAEPNPPAPFPKKEGGDGSVSPPARVETLLSSECLSPPSFLGKGAGGFGSSFHVGKAIYYAPRAFRFADSGPWDADLAGAFDPWRLPGFADIPEPGAVIEAGHPVLTFFVSGSTPAEVRERLQSRAAELDRNFTG